MSEKAAFGNGKWANAALLEVLTMGFYHLAKDSLDKAAKDALVEKVHARGFEEVTWEAIR